uniref:C2H2-type domain-containing protein n=1 Tax=Steinernema glaseri TaxID=37863 RepID=A0A1I8ADH8_9BILA
MNKIDPNLSVDHYQLGASSSTSTSAYTRSSGTTSVPQRLVQVLQAYVPASTVPNPMPSPSGIHVNPQLIGSKSTTSQGPSSVQATVVTRSNVSDPRLRGHGAANNGSGPEVKKADPRPDPRMKASAPVVPKVEAGRLPVQNYPRHDSPRYTDCPNYSNSPRYDIDERVPPATNGINRRFTPLLVQKRHAGPYNFVEKKRPRLPSAPTVALGGHAFSSLPVRPPTPTSSYGHPPPMGIPDHLLGPSAALDSPHSVSMAPQPGIHQQPMPNAYHNPMYLSFNGTMMPPMGAPQMPALGQSMRPPNQSMPPMGQPISSMGPPMPPQGQPMHPMSASKIRPMESQASIAPLPPQKPVIVTDETPRFEGLPQNNRIFVNGRAYEVFYIDNVAVIERYGLPHRIFFSGPPRDVVIDGVPHRVAFGEEKRVFIDGELHVLRLGSPSRELYIGGYPFKGIFGGPPIIATINGRRHEIRLGGPAPEVNIDADPSYELQRYMPEARRNVGMNPAPKLQSKEPKKPSEDIFTLLKRLEKQGLFKKPTGNAPETKQPEPPKSVAPSRPVIHDFSSQRGDTPPNDLLETRDVRFLGIRYSKVVESILTKKECCPECCLSFEGLSTDLQNHHKDDHVQQRLKRLRPGGSAGGSRPWYTVKKSFYETSSQAELLRIEQEKNGVGTVANSNVPSDAVERNFCETCHEKFDEYYDDDEDVWMLKDSSLHNGKAYHTGCVMDAPTISTTEADIMAFANPKKEDGDFMICAMTSAW